MLAAHPCGRDSGAVRGAMVGTWTFLSRGRQYEIRRFGLTPPRGRPLQFFTPEAARDYLGRCAIDPEARSWLRRIAIEARPLGHQVSGRSGQDWLVLLAQAIARGDLALSVSDRPLTTAYDFGEEEPVAPVAPELTWVEFVVVWAADGSPVADLPLEVTVPGQSPAPPPTDGSGKIRVDSVRAGPCRLSSSFAGVLAAKCVSFVEMGEPAQPAGGPPKKKRSDEPPPQAIAFLRPHRVRATDTLASLAASVGLSWQELARFNWGTDDPSGVNQHLRDDVGCWKKTADGASHVFSDFDDPGVLVLPRRWSVDDLATSDTHHVQVRRLPPPPRFLTWSA